MKLNELARTNLDFMKILKQSANFTLYAAGKHFRIRCRLPFHKPHGRRISAYDANYLQHLDKSFDAACVMDFGVGVFQDKR
jgi:hypothetical protein